MGEAERSRDDVSRSVGKALRLLRTQHGFNQVELCERTGLSSSRMSRYESGHTIPSLLTVQRILDGLGVSFADLQDALDRVAPAESPRRKPQAAKGPFLLIAVAQELPDSRTAELAAALAANLDPAEKEATLWTDLAAIFQEGRRREERQREREWEREKERESERERQQEEP